MRAMGAENVSPGASHYCVWTLGRMSERVSLLGVGKVRIGALGDETRVTGGAVSDRDWYDAAHGREVMRVARLEAEDVGRGGHGEETAAPARTGSREGETVRLARRRRWGR